jgi:hypothetical protein
MAAATCCLIFFLLDFHLHGRPDVLLHLFMRPVRPSSSV